MTKQNCYIQSYRCEGVNDTKECYSKGSRMGAVSTNDLLGRDDYEMTVAKKLSETKNKGEAQDYLKQLKLLNC
jgi:hypothetical protein